jgi:hypothetical protein
LPGTLQRPATVEEGREGAALSCALAAVAEMSARPIAAQIDLCNNFIIRSVLFRFFVFFRKYTKGNGFPQIIFAFLSKNHVVNVSFSLTSHSAFSHASIVRVWEEKFTPNFTISRPSVA